MNTRKFVFDAFDNKETDRVPVSFWFHFAPDRLFEESEEVLQKNINGHRAYIKAFHPDFVKLMSDGYFTLPYPEIQGIRTTADLTKIRHGNAEKWIAKQVKLVSTLVSSWQKEIPAFYNIFAPATYLKWLLEKQGISFGALVDENPALVRDALNEIAARSDLSLQAGEQVSISIRPEKIHLYDVQPSDSADHIFYLRGIVENNYFVGAMMRTSVRLPDGHLLFISNGQNTESLPKPGIPVWLTWRPQDAVAVINNQTTEETAASQENSDEKRGHVA